MYYVRMSLMTALPGNEPEVARIMDDLVSYYAKQDGYVTGYKLKSADDIGDIGRVTIWKSGEAADHTAQSPHVLSQRADLMPLIEEDSHSERSFYAEEEGKLLSELLQRLGP